MATTTLISNKWEVLQQSKDQIRLLCFDRLVEEKGENPFMTGIEILKPNDAGFFNIPRELHRVLLVTHWLRYVLGEFSDKNDTFFVLAPEVHLKNGATHGRPDLSVLWPKNEIVQTLTEKARRVLGTPKSPKFIVCVVEVKHKLGKKREEYDVQVCEEMFAAANNLFGCNHLQNCAKMFGVLTDFESFYFYSVDTKGRLVCTEKLSFAIITSLRPGSEQWGLYAEGDAHIVFRLFWECLERAKECLIPALGKNEQTFQNVKKKRKK